MSTGISFPTADGREGEGSQRTQEVWTGRTELGINGGRKMKSGSTAREVEKLKDPDGQFSHIDGTEEEVEITPNGRGGLGDQFGWSINLLRVDRLRSLAHATRLNRVACQK